MGTKNMWVESLDAENSNKEGRSSIEDRVDFERSGILNSKFEFQILVSWTQAAGSSEAKFTCWLRVMLTAHNMS